MRIAMLGAKAIPCPGGIQTYTEQIGRRLAERGYDVTIYCRRHFLPTGSQFPPDDYRGMHRVLTHGMSGKYTDAITHAFSSALHAKRQDYDVVHIHGSAQAVVTPLLKMMRRQPVVVTVHAMDWKGAKWGSASSRMMRWGGRVPTKWADEITVVSRHLQEHYLHEFGRATTYIPTGVDLPDLPPPQLITEKLGLEGRDYLLSVGRITQEKGLEHLIEAYRGLDTDKKLVIAGGVNHPDPYCRRILSHASDRILFPGFATGQLLAELFANAYLYVQSSLLEGMPITVLESLSYGRCVVTSDIPAMNEALSGCGYMTPAGDASALREQLSKLLQSPDLVDSEFDKARTHVARNHSWDTAVQQFEGVYQRAIDSG
jgi:glycosyltransferase involved in cell wall biosynthesis